MNWPKLNQATARIVAGAGIFVLTVMVLGIMVWVPELAKDDLFKLIAQAIVVQGLVGLAMASLFTGTQRDHKDGDEP